MRVTGSHVLGEIEPDSWLTRRKTFILAHSQTINGETKKAGVL